MSREYEEQNRKRLQARAAVRDAGIEPGQSSRSAVLSKRDHAVASGLVQRKAQVETASVPDFPSPVQIATPAELPAVQLKCAKCEEEEDAKRRQNPAALAASEALQIRRQPSQQGADDDDQNPGTSVPPLVMELLQLKRSRGAGDGSDPMPNVESYLRSSRGSGEALSPSVRAHLEPRFGADFGGVRVHTDSTAARVSQALGAHAFTYGRDIYFADGQYNPQSASGRWLLAHELTHTVQQTGARRPAVQTHLSMGRVNDPYEQEADRVADAVTSMAEPTAPTAVARKADDTAVQPAETSEVAVAMMLQRHAASLLDMVGLSTPELVQGHLFGGDCVAEYWNLSAAIASLLAAAGAGLALILAPDPTTITKWVAIGAIAGVISGLAWTINAIISLINCKQALPETAAREEEIRRLRQRQDQLERTLQQLQDQRGGQQQGNPQQGNPQQQAQPQQQ